MIRLSKSCLGNEEIKAVSSVMEKEYLGMGVEVQRFEELLTNFFGRPAVCVSSGTAALHLALQAIGLEKGDEVLVQSLTYVASFQAISATGARPIPCDVDPDTMCIELQDAKSKLTKRTKAIMPVHYSGGVGKLDQIYAFAGLHDLRVIEDSAHAFGSKYKGEKVGSFGDIACFSFDGIKNITSGEGGCVVSNDNLLLNSVRDARLLGVEEDTGNRFSGSRSWSFDVTNQGFRYHMSDIMAAIGIQQFKKRSGFFEKRQALARRYDALLKSSSSLQLIKHNYNNVVPHIYVIKLSNAFDRDCIRAQLQRKKIQTGFHYYPNHWLSLYKGNGINLFNTDMIYGGLLTLPLHTDLNMKDIEYICSTLKSILSNA